MLKKMRWTDNSMGSNFDYGWSDINQAFAAGNVGMYISGSDVYTNLVQASNIDPSIYGLAPIPLAKNAKNAGVLGGGTLAAVRPDANAAHSIGKRAGRRRQWRCGSTAAAIAAMNLAIATGDTRAILAGIRYDRSR